MSFSNLNTFIQYTADGVQDTFAINFHILENSDEIVAKVYDVTDIYNPVEEIIAYSIDHTNYPASEVVFVTPPANGREIHIQRSLIKFQNSNFAKGSFPAEAVEESFDKSIMMIQENAAEIDRCVREPLFGASLQDQINSNQANISSNDTDIATNAQAIAANAQAIAANAQAISDNADAISDNADAISDINDALAIIAEETVVSLAVASTTHNASTKEILLVKATDITIELPAPILSGQVKVKMVGNQTNCIVNSAAGIDGFGVSYTLQSEYESISLVSDGTQWFII